MNPFKIYGTVENRPVWVSWSEGTIEGDQEALLELFALASIMDRQPVGPEPEGPFTHEDHLKDPLSAQILIEDVIDEVTGIEGLLPNSLVYHEYPAAA